MKFAEWLRQLFSNREAPEAEDMFLLRADGRAVAHYTPSSYATQRIKWVSIQTDSNGCPLREREPSETTTVYSREDPFRVAGKDYPNFESFLKSEDGDWAEDLYGRKVLCIKERFPCFDSFDFLYEHRFFRWFFIRKGNSISRVYVTDERDEVYVTEDVQNVERLALNFMQQTGFCQPPKEES